LLFEWIRVDTLLSLAELTKFWIAALIYKLVLCHLLKNRGLFYRSVDRTNIAMESVWGKLYFPLRSSVGPNVL